MIEVVGFLLTFFISVGLFVYLDSKKIPLVLTMIVIIFAQIFVTLAFKSLVLYSTVQVLSVVRFK